MVLVDKCEEFLCVTSDNTEISFSTDAIWVLANNDDKLTFYLTDRGPDVTEYEKEIVRPNSNKLYSDKAKECAKQLGSERPEYVQYALYNEDERYCAVVYWDDTIEIFDAENRKVYVRSGSTDYEIPVYDLEELLALARVQ